MTGGGRLASSLRLPPEINTIPARGQPGGSCVPSGLYELGVGESC